MGSSLGSFYRRWIWANSWAEALGLGLTFMLGRAIAPHLGRVPSTSAILLGAAVAILLGAFLEGVVVGYAQARALRSALPELSARAWIGASALGAGAAWVLGMIPSTIMGLLSSPSGPVSSPPAEPSRWLQYALALVLGAITGPILGFAQARVLRRHVPRAGRWLWANALAWSLGMVAIFVGMDLLPWGEGGIVLWLGPVVISGVAGALAGAVHGRFLARWLARAEPAR